MARFNEINIQMLSKSLHQNIFKNETTKVNQKTMDKISKHLKEHNLWGRKGDVLPDVELELPKLYGNNIDEHFKIIGANYARPFKTMLNNLIQNKLPIQPKKWKFQPGWTRYEGEKSEPVPYPVEKCIVFDIEICVKEGNYPTLATAASNLAWYSWCSQKLVNEEYNWANEISLDNLIPLETVKGSKYEETNFLERLVIGHNVSFDRSYVKEQYLLQGTKLRFLDTMSLHMCVSGLTGIQRAMSVANKSTKSALTKDQEDFRKAAFMWLDIGSLNNLGDVYKLYCEGDAILKDQRDIFVSGNLDDVRRDFQSLTNYCARDVTATFEIVQKLSPMFFKRFPHPVTLAGMLEMSVPYLPINQNWKHYLKSSQDSYDELEREMKLSLGQVANDACSLLIDEKYKKDPWLWDLDWKTQELKMNKTKPVSKRKKASASLEVFEETQASELNDKEVDIETEFDSILKTAQNLRKVRPFLPGYPLWYRELCIKPNSGVKWKPGPALISTQIRSVPKLLRLMWDGYPLHYDKKEGWGYLVPKKSIREDCQDQIDDFPIDCLLKIMTKLDGSPKVDSIQDDDDLQSLISKSEVFMGDRREEWQLWQLILEKEFANNNDTSSSKNNAPCQNVKLKGCDFYRLPHKDGPKNRVGNPLAKDFLTKITDGTLTAYAGDQATRALTISKMISYWKNAHKRIKNQMTVWLNQDELPSYVVKNKSYDEEESYGAILPRLVTAGTVTRRAVEPTWLTASNAYVDRVGSELKGMVQAPPNYHFVGADVDSEELWIAAIIGDAHFAGLHGCTAFSWMTLQGKKSEGTDLHSRTAATVGISRDQAKILNYGRIYGAGLPFAQRLLMQFNHRLSEEDAANKAKKMYKETKGVKRKVYPLAEINEELEVIVLSRDAIEPQRQWFGGSESHMFNKLESIAQSEQPTTPVLECRISRSLEPATVNNNFMTSRINWVVQSSAVDFLHIMVVCMKWLMNEYDIEGRFTISIHDEVRYMIRSEDRYRAALALQITNLLTRCLFAYKLDMNDLPQSVAFFSSVDIDKCLRKEVSLDCKTTSNPHGLEKGYGIPKGESLDIFKVLEKTNGCLTKK